MAPSVRTRSICNKAYQETLQNHYNDVIISEMTSQVTSLTIVYSIIYSGADQRKYQSSASVAFVRGIHRWPINFPHKGPVTRKMFPFDDVIMIYHCNTTLHTNINVASVISAHGGTSHWGSLCPLLLIWIHFNPNMDNQLQPLLSVGWNYLFIPKLQRWYGWSLGMVV